MMHHQLHQDMLELGRHIVLRDRLVVLFFLSFEFRVYNVIDFPTKIKSIVYMLACRTNIQGIFFPLLTFLQLLRFDRQGSKIGESREHEDLQ